MPWHDNLLQSALIGLTASALVCGCAEGIQQRPEPDGAGVMDSTSPRSDVGVPDMDTTTTPPDLSETTSPPDTSEPPPAPVPVNSFTLDSGGALLESSDYTMRLRVGGVYVTESGNSDHRLFLGPVGIVR